MSGQSNVAGLCSVRQEASLCSQTWLPGQLPALPPKLTFFGQYVRRCSPATCPSATWGCKQHVHCIKIHYGTLDQSVIAEIDDMAFTMQLSNRLGLSLEPWDLHVGAVLTILGHKVILKGCNLATRQWLANQAERLVKERKVLERELQKFMHVTPVVEQYARQSILQGTDWFCATHNPVNPKYSSSGQLNLRRLMIEVEELRLRLAQFRAKLPMYGTAPVPKLGIRLRGPFSKPADWVGTKHETQSGAATKPQLLPESSSLLQMQGYSEWIDSIPLASSAAHISSRITPRKVDH